MTKFILALVIVVSVVSQTPSPRRGEPGQQKQEQSSDTQQPTITNQRGTEEAPFGVKKIPTVKTQEESAQEAKDRQEKAANDRNLVIATYILAAIAAFQLFVFGYQAIQLRRTVEAAGEQVKDTKRAIAEASRSAAAMEEVSKHIEVSLGTAAQQSESMKESVKEAARLASAMEVVSKEIGISAKAAMESVAAVKERTAQQMRAYLCVVIGGGIVQDRANNLKFEAKPTLINAGHTPAHNVSYKAKAEILPVPLPNNFAFPLPDEAVGGSLLGPQQNVILSGLVDDYCDDGDIDKIKMGNGEALFVWGIVNYEDVFGESHFTKFCQTTHWLKDNTITGFYIDRHNDAD